MKKLIRTNHNLKNLDLVILIARVSIAALMLSHGLPKLVSFLAEGPAQFPGILGMSPELSLGLAVFAEVICSLFILVGFGTRYATIPLIVTMLVAVLYVHVADPFVKQEPALHYLLVYGLLFLTGSGKYSVDHLLQQKKMTIGYSGVKVEDPTVGIYN
jgi:putative oxidoreductase